MNAEVAILQEIIEYPGDDSPRLIYADWLEEHGDSDRAEFIRVQCELARLAPDDARYSELQARERRLHSAHARRWQEGLSHALFRRGFVDEWHFCEPREFTGSAREVFHKHPVRSVYFGTQDDPGWGPELAACTYLARLRTLSLRVPRSCHVSAADLLAVTGSAYLTALRGLDVGENDELDDETFAEMIGAEVRPALFPPTMTPAFRSLRYLGLAGGIGHGRLGDSAVKALTGSPLAHTLTHLDLSGNCGISPAGFGQLFDSPLWPRLEELGLSNLYQPTAEVASLLGVALGRGRLKRFSLAWFVAHDADLAGQLIDALAAAPSWGPLRALDLSGLQLSGSPLRTLTQCSHLAGLSRLDLYWSELSDDDMIYLAGCPYLSGLTALRLADNHEIGNVGMQALAGSPYLRKLVYLNLEGTRVTGAGITSLARSPGIGRLRLLVLPTTVGDAGLKALARSPHAGRLTTLMVTGAVTRTSGKRSPRVQRVTEVGVQALVDSPHLRHLTSLQFPDPLTERGQRALLEAEHIAWPRLSEHSLKSDELKAIHAKRFEGHQAFSELLEVAPFFSWHV